MKSYSRTFLLAFLSLVVSSVSSASADGAGTPNWSRITSDISNLDGEVVARNVQAIDVSPTSTVKRSLVLVHDLRTDRRHAVRSRTNMET